MKKGSGKKEEKNINKAIIQEEKESTVINSAISLKNVKIEYKDHKLSSEHDFVSTSLTKVDSALTCVYCKKGFSTTDAKSKQIVLAFLLNKTTHQLCCFQSLENRKLALAHPFHTWCISELITNTKPDTSCPICLTNGSEKYSIRGKANNEEGDNKEEEENYFTDKLGVDIGGVIISKGSDNGEDEGIDDTYQLTLSYAFFLWRCLLNCTS